LHSRIIQHGTIIGAGASAVSNGDVFCHLLADIADVYHMCAGFGVSFVMEA
jgi:hypothetical protein